MIYSVERTQDGWNIIDENSKEKIAVQDGSVITFNEGGNTVIEIVSEKTRADALIKAWKGR
ncbi:MAG TPA: hypothetical protein VN455_04815 [Methanotrichaceae archaeon]|nr:hypothetical protein [Methanotrichaceae archaeon]